MFITVAWLLLVAAWLGLLVVTATAPRLQNRGSLLSLLLALALITVASLTIALAEAYRFAVWIEGPELVVRHWSGEKRWHFPSAAVAVRTSPGTVRLAVQDEVSGRSTQLRLRVNRVHNISTLAGVIAASRPQDLAARQAADALMSVSR